MNWRGRTQIAIAVLGALALGGCNSTIETYDSTFTAGLASSSAAMTAFGAEPRTSNRALKRLKSPSKSRKTHFIEFRARSALSYGHASVVFGELNRKGKLPIDKKGVLMPDGIEISGLHPATQSSVPWSVGHLVPVPAETGPSDGDFEEAYVTARYRVDLTKQEFREVVAIVHQHKETNKLWYAPLTAANCLGYIGGIAKDMGLKVPLLPHFPKEYVENLAELNG